MLECGVLHSIENTSDHSPVFCDIKKKITSKIVREEVNEDETRVRTQSLTDEEWMAFHNDLEERLAGIQRPKCTECKIPNCVAEENRQQTDRYVEEVLRAIDTSITSVAG